VIEAGYISKRTSYYATTSDFCGIFKTDMKSLYLLSLLLTADSKKAEQCFVGGLDDCSDSQVFNEWAQSWARRAIIKNAVQLIQPAPANSRRATNSRGSDKGEAQVWPELPAEFSALLNLNTFERFAFILSDLEGYSDQDSALLLGCTRQTLIAARVRAERQIAHAAAVRSDTPALEQRKEGAVIELGFPATLATSA